ncbi:MAG: UDP-N-acetylmuramate dehydrogenase [Coprobacillaceae bacterium]
MLTKDMIEIKYKEAINKYTFTKVGGKVDMLAFPKTLDEIKELIEICKTENIPWMVLGNASNVIIGDGGYRGMIIMTIKMNTIEIRDNKVIAQAGALLSDVTRAAWKRSLSGLEFACGIPGSIGGAVYMNAGAYGGEISDVITSLTYVTKEGEVLILTKEELGYRYRYSQLQEMDGVVISATFSLKLGNREEIKDVMDHLTILRETKQPLEYPSCGSVFKRPKGYYTGQLIQEAGLQGKQIGGAQISTKHAGFIVNIEEASASDYIALIHHIQEIIMQKYQVQLEPEVRILGEM